MPAPAQASCLAAALSGIARSSAFSPVRPHSRPFNRILARSTAFSLIFPRRFSVFITKNAISVFLCHFMLIFQPAAGMHDVNFGRFPLFEPLFPASRHLCGTSEAFPRRFRSASGCCRAVSGDSRTLTHASDRLEKAPGEDKN